MFNNWFGETFNEMREEKLGEVFNAVGEFVKDSNFKYINIVQAPGPKTGKGENIIDYLEILGKKFSGDVTIDYFFGKSLSLEVQFGNRTKSSAEGVDWKALSHSVRVLFEVEELLDTGFVTFPLLEKEFVKEVKEGKVPVDAVMMFVNAKLDQVKEKLDSSDLPEKSNRETMDWLELSILEWFGGLE
jgi:hypothetical protein